MKAGELAQKSVNFMRAARNVLHNAQAIIQYAFGCYPVQDLPRSLNASVPHPGDPSSPILPLAFNAASYASTHGPDSPLVKPTHYESVTVLSLTSHHWRICHLRL